MRLTGNQKEGGRVMACTCGHSIEEHGHDPEYPGSTACTECGCIAYEESEDDEQSGRAALAQSVEKK